MRPPQKAGPIQTGGSSLSYGLAHPSGARLPSGGCGDSELRLQLKDTLAAISKLEGRPVRCLVDTGAAVSIVPSNLVRRLSLFKQEHKRQTLRSITDQ